jgi:DNA-binding ferritin-like protein
MSNLKTLKPFQKGYDPRRNLEGRPKGAQSFRTLFDTAIKEVNKSLKLGKEPDAVLVEIVKKGIAQALKGNYPFYKDILDRLYGQAKQTIEEEKKVLVLTDEEDEENKK